MNVTLSPELQKFVAQKIEAGEYTSASQMVREALEAMRTKESLSDRDIDELRRDIAVGLAQLDRGETVEFSAKDIQSLGRRILRARLTHNK